MNTDELSGKIEDLEAKHEKLCAELRPVWPRLKELAGKNGGKA